MNIALAILGCLIACVSFTSGPAIYGAAKNAIHEIYAALLMITRVLGLLILAIAVGADRICSGIRDSKEQASPERPMLAEAIRTLAEHQRPTGAPRAQSVRSRTA